MVSLINLISFPLTFHIYHINVFLFFIKIFSITNIRAIIPFSKLYSEFKLIIFLNFLISGCLLIIISLLDSAFINKIFLSNNFDKFVLKKY